MLKVTRRLLSLICVVIFMLQIVPVFAQNVSFDLESLGITAGIDMNRDMNGGVRRDEFAHMTVQLLSYDGVPVADEPGFADIEGSPYKNSVLLLRQMNFVTGSSDSTFNPDRYITYMEACKILVDALGYQVMLSERTLENYAFVAGSIGLTKAVNSGEEYISMNDVLRMFYNALDINRMTQVLQGGVVVSYEISEGNTLRAYLTRGVEELEKMEGIVTADISSYMYAELPALKPTQLEINGKVLNYDGIAPVGLVGQAVDLYVKTSGDYKIITSIQPKSDNVIATFETDDITNISDNKITVQEENEAKQKYKVNSDTIYLYNKRPERNFVVNDLLSYENAEVYMIDNNEDEVFDVVFITEYADGIVERVYAEGNRVYFKEGYMPNGQKYVDLDSTERYTYITIKDAKGNDVAFDAIQPDMVLSISMSENGEVRQVVLGFDTIEGAIESKDEYGVVINGVEYEYIIPANDLQFGKTIIGYLNFKNQIVRAEYKPSEQNYAYVYKFQNASGFDAPKVKLLLPAPVSVRTTTVFDDNTGNTTTTRKLFCRNENTAIYEFSNKVTVETTNVAGVVSVNRYSSSSLNSSSFINQVISYKLDAEGKIYYVEILNPSTDKLNRTYSASQQIFGKTSGLAFGITNDVTQSICIPTNDSSDLSDDDLTVYVELLDSTPYTVQGYAYDENTYICDLIIVTEQLISGAAGNVNSTSEVGLVVKQSSVLEDNGDEYIKLTMLTKDGKQEFLVSNRIAARNNFLNIKEGDLIAYSQDTFDNLNGYMLLQSANNFSDFNRTENGFDKFCGEVTDIDYNYPSNKRNMWVTTLNAGHTTDSSSASFDIIKSNPAPIFLMENKEYSKITVDDIQFGDRIFVVSANDKVLAVVVKR